MVSPEMWGLLIPSANADGTDYLASVNDGYQEALNENSCEHKYGALQRRAQGTHAGNYSSDAGDFG